jgi:hypothetical protein
MSDLFGMVQFTGEDMTWPAVQYDRIAVGGRGELLLVSVVAPTQIVKGIRGWLNTAKRGIATATGAKVKKSFEDEWRLREPGNLHKLDAGYATDVHRLAYGLAHAMFIARTPGLLLSLAEEALWQELNTTRFTTPLLRGWMPWVTQQLVERGLLVEADCHRCRCGVLQTTTADLDTVVSSGLKDGHIAIRGGRDAIPQAIPA